MQISWNKIIKNKFALAMLISVLGIILILFSCIPQNKTTEKNFSDAEYISELERRIEEIVKTIDGAGDCKVLISVLSTTESVYVKDIKKYSDADSIESENTVLTMKDGNGNQTALVTKQLMPEISGVIITCDGGGSLNVRSSVTEAVCTLLGIGANKVCVIAKS